MKNIIVAFVSILIVQVSSFYDVDLNDATGTPINVSAYEGKRILLVNIATNSEHASQLAGLQQLQSRFADSLVVIAIPSNSFGQEPRTAAQVKSFCEQLYQSSFVITELANATGSNKHPVFQWLTSQGQNGVTSAPVTGDFQKFLISKNGELIGLFASSVQPLDNQIIQTITAAQ